MPDEFNPPSIADIERAQVSLPAPIETNYRDLYEELKVKFDEVSEDYSSALIEKGALERRNKTHDILDKLIEPYAKSSFRFMCAYAGVVAVLLILSGFHTLGFSLPEGVLNFLVGSTAITVIGLVGMVLTGVFVARPK